MVKRQLLYRLMSRLNNSPAVVLLGPRQVGKTTLAHDVAENMDSIYLDLERESDLRRMDDPESYLERHADKLMILDEVQRLPGFFQPLRSIIDSGRRKGLTTCRYLLLGSASGDLLRQTGESLAGRVSYMELPPLQPGEFLPKQQDDLWLRGGFPDSFLARDDRQSMEWRQDLISTYLEREMPAYGLRLPASTMRRLWSMIAYQQGGLINLSRLSRNLMIDIRSIDRYLDLLSDLMLLRRLRPWHGNPGKRLVKSAKVYIRDSGILHALTGISGHEQLLGHPLVGQSWEGFVIETLLNAAPAETIPGFYRTANGAEVDLLLEIAGQGLWAIEIKRSAGKPRKGFYTACQDLNPKHRFLVYPGGEQYPVGDGTEAIGLPDLVTLLQNLDPGPEKNPKNMKSLKTANSKFAKNHIKTSK